MVSNTLLMHVKTHTNMCLTNYLKHSIFNEIYISLKAYVEKLFVSKIST